ncbi:putative D-serine dehydratase [Thalassobacillus devorans]|uniref:Probable D-serine dehydratase n=1 Tax=Thalassobacillus devorans TaxID=279813 RepID=A0ABQ1NJY3_9BACI|nr:D-serine ammonia-lyase [Thalassobacillus devorans]NIK27604.1 D-serine dehydratase [Thalassobacillus devorans]GGC79069.1 putative D-serine dehydratase [Thalassobacillus devorans]
MTEKIAGKTIAEWQEEYPLLKAIVATEEVYWENNDYQPEALGDVVSREELDEAAALFDRFLPFFKKAFPEVDLPSEGIVSPLREIAGMKKELEAAEGVSIRGELWLKCDHELPIAGSIKARGGFYEILQYAEQLAIDHGMLAKSDDYSKLYGEPFKSFYSNYSIAVGSTGNLGLSIGIISAKIGFQVTVHMSQDAKQWKKDLLRSYGVTVVEHPADFSIAVEKGREMCRDDENCHFVDDEDSKNLFLGYTVAAKEVARQLEEEGVTVDAAHPLIVYLPCGVGGGPGGVAYGLKQVYGEHVHCLFAEPTHAPSMLLGLLTGLHHNVSVQDFGIDNITEADGLAVGRPSGFVAPILEQLIAGIYTVEDRELFKMLYQLYRSEGLFLEPSALAGMYGPAQVTDKRLFENLDQATHLVWSTGGNLVPEKDREAMIKKGKATL